MFQLHPAKAARFRALPGHRMPPMPRCIGRGSAPPWPYRPRPWWVEVLHLALGAALFLAGTAGAMLAAIFGALAAGLM